MPPAEPPPDHGLPRSRALWRIIRPRLKIAGTMPTFDRDAYRAAICERIAIARTNSLLTQEALAERIGANTRTYRAWERGTVPTADWIGLIADECHVTAEWIIGRPHGEPVPLVNRKAEATLLRATEWDEGTRQRATRLSTIADEGLEAMPTLEAFAIRVGKVWSHLESLREPQPTPPKGKDPSHGRRISGFRRSR